MYQTQGQVIAISINSFMNAMNDFLSLVEGNDFQNETVQ